MLRIDCLRKEIRSMDRAVVKRQRLTRSMCASASHVRNSTVSLAIAMRAKDRVGAAIEKERKEGRKSEVGFIYTYRVLHMSWNLRGKQESSQIWGRRR
jgi:hypothetical protein